MANAVTVQVLEDGPRYRIIKVIASVDTADLAETIVADASTLTPETDMGAPLASFAIDWIGWSVGSTILASGLVGLLQWKATANADAYVLAGSDHQKFPQLIVNNAGAGKTGSLVLVTRGWAATMIGYLSFVIRVVKMAT